MTTHNVDEIISTLSPEGQRYFGNQKKSESQNKREDGKKLKSDAVVWQISFLDMECYLLDQIYHNNESAFIKYSKSSGEVEIVTHVMQGDVKVVPM